MAKDDMEVIIYKILSYLYSSLKAGHKTSLEEVAWRCKLFDITREYWIIVLKEMIDDGLVSGIKYVEAKDMEGIIVIGNFSITKKGREYLTNNSTMAKVKEMLGSGFEIALSALIGKF